MTRIDDQLSESHPHDRGVFFSDAVFAISMTLLAIEIRVPESDIEAYGMYAALLRLTPLFIAYAVSFLVTALFWAQHMQTWKHVRHVTGSLLWLNTFQLMFVALVPFSSGLYAEHVGDNTAFAFYCLNLSGVALFAWLSRLYVIRHERLAERLDAHEISWMKLRTLTSLLVFLACIPLAYWQPLLGRMGFVLIFILQALLKMHYRRKAVAA
ncbi:MAG: TMEM175 family protein [Pseudoxanthomonas sp.]